MHHGAGVIVCPQVIDLVQVVLEEVELHPALDVGPVDGDVPVPVGPALLVPEAAGVHELVHHDAGVDAAPAQTHLLGPARPPHAAAAPAALHDVDVSPLVGPGHELDAGLVVVILEGLGNDAPLPAVELAGDDVGDHAPGPLPVTVPDGVATLGTVDILPQSVEIDIGDVALEQVGGEDGVLKLKVIALVRHDLGGAEVVGVEMVARDVIHVRGLVPLGPLSGGQTLLYRVPVHEVSNIEVSLSSLLRSIRSSGHIITRFYIVGKLLFRVEVTINLDVSCIRLAVSRNGGQISQVFDVKVRHSVIPMSRCLTDSTLYIIIEEQESCGDDSEELHVAMLPLRCSVTIYSLTPSPGPGLALDTTIISGLVQPLTQNIP